MHIIGIKIGEGCNHEIIKNLKPGWYPFGNYNEPTKENGYKWRNGDSQSDRLYQCYPNMPQISISCVIGMNGSGKTTLFDILFRIINNFSSFIKLSKRFDRYSLDSEDGVNAKMYFEVEGNVGCIDNHGYLSDLYFRIDGDSNLSKIIPDDYSIIVKDLFYTIGVNYSLYSMDFRDDDGNVVGKNKWLCNIFNNEAEYNVPITFSPYRTEGQIDIRKEENLANRRLITLAILLHSQQNELLKEYKPSIINYTINKQYIDSLKENVQNLSIRRSVSGSISNIIEGFKKEWKKEIAIDIQNNIGISSNDLYDYLAIESSRICLTYKSYRESLDLDSIYNAEDRNDDTSANSGRYGIVVKRLHDFKNKSSITADIRQILLFLSRKVIEKDSGSIQIDIFINKNLSKGQNAFINYNEVYEILPPQFYNLELLFTKVDDSDNLIPLSQFSSGEKQLLYSHCAILYHIYNIANANDEVYDVPYKHINIVIDEVELYSHPEFQRKYIALLIDMLAGLHIDNTVIRSINVIIATHSPFILSDIPKENILCLKNGCPQKVKKETYCANIYDLLKQSFFLDYPMGEVARKLIDEIVLAYNNPHDSNSLKDKILENASFYQYLGRIISESIIRKNINVMIQSLLGQKKKGLSDLLLKKEQLMEQMISIDEQIKKSYEKD